MDPQLLSYIIAQLEKKIPEEEIRAALKTRGWPAGMIDKAFGTIYSKVVDKKDAFGFSIHRLRSPRQLLRDTFSTLTDHLLDILPFLLIAIFSGVLLNVFIFSRLTAATPTAISWVVAFTATFAMLTIAAWAAVGVLLFLKNHQIQPHFSDNALESARRILPFWWTLIVLTSVVIGGTLFLVPGFLFSIWFIFAPVISVAEEENGLESLLLSYEYAKTHFLSIAFRTIFIFIFQFFSSTAIILIIYVSSSLIPAKEFLPFIFVGAISIIVTTSSFFYLIYLNHLYEDVRSLRTFAQQKIPLLIKIVFIGSGIVGFIASIAIPYLIITKTIPLNFPFNFDFFIAKQPSLDTSRREDIKYLRSVMETFYAENQRYPATLPEMIPTFVNTIPTDPETNIMYEYIQKRGGQDYELCTIIEKKKLCATPNKDLPEK